VDVVRVLNDCRFVWDSAKARVNLAKHGVSFEQAMEAFFDPFVRVIDNTSRESPEIRDAKEHFRIVSARRATIHERKCYES
jgi:uncharacterized DUF497 family protein